MRKYLYPIFLIPFILLGCSAETDNKPISAVERIKEEKAIQPSVDGMKSALLSNGMLVPLGDVSIPVDNPMEQEVLELGRILFFDSRLSGNNEISCATCHDPEKGYGDDRPTFEKVDGDDGARNSPTIINSGYYSTYFWDGRASSLEEQALGPIQNPDEMDQSLDELLIELRAVKGYEDLFASAFEDGITENNIAKALAAFQRLIVVKDTPYDQFLNGDPEALTDQEVRGLNLFAGKAFCSTCHNGENLSDNQYYNIGINTDDVGRFAVTGDESDIGRIRTPSLYGITHTEPYMRDGSLATLEEVIDYYDRGGDGHPNTSFFMKQFMNPLGLTEEEKDDLLAFLEVLGGEPPVYTKPELP
ncbi:cytochrome c peroxidase [Mesobacillus persicus]|uniref:Methylamine utilization protein MauG n=1 Tax=Mesobacillus persicus TaxID=930146 RepID=A0A1H8EQT9_9BACI|nr:cytochrome c peroxidase [Mesobacillus persicus]SEN21802.1 cytochrome c peroxidase [Mesobacillus persicus]